MGDVVAHPIRNAAMHRMKATSASKANTSFVQDAWGNNR